MQLLALRDELTTRAFDDPDAWWPQLPDVIGGRDRTAGGTWCASRVATGVTALVLNRPQKRVADAGAASRGVLPLLAVEHEQEWTGHAALAGMASFLLVLAQPGALTSWAYDGEKLVPMQHEPGTHMFTSGGEEDGKAERHLAAFAAGDFPAGWRALVTRHPPADDLGALVVRHRLETAEFATVFGQLIEATPGHLSLAFSREPWVADSWTERDGSAGDRRPRDQRP